MVKTAPPPPSPPPSASKPVQKSPPRPFQPVVAIGKDTTEPIRGIKKAMVQSMNKAHTIPHFGYYDEIDMTKLVQLRYDLKSACKERGIKLSYMPFIIKVSVMYNCMHSLLFGKSFFFFFLVSPYLSGMSLN